MGHNDAGRDQARQFLAQARHQTDNALAVLRKKAGTGPDTGLDVRGAGVSFDPLDTASGRLALAVGDLLQAVTLLLGDAPPMDNNGWSTGLDERVARLEASVSVRDYRVDPPPGGDHLPFVAGEPDPETAPALPGEERH